MNVFIELTFIIAVAAVFAILARIFRQPLIVGYILAGIFSGPYFLNILQSEEFIDLFSKIGITALLFIVGLHLSPKVIREVGKVSLITGVGQVVFTSTIGFFIALSLGIDRIAAFYVAIALTFSSTIIILKLLSDRGDLNKLYGKISIGFLLIQDVIAIIILLLLPTFSETSDPNIIYTIGHLLIKGVGVLLVLYFVSGFIIPKTSKFAASSTELLFLFSIAWGFGLSSFFYILGFSIEIGALIAGITLSMTPFAYEIGARLKPLRDFFIVLFFVLLGSQMTFDNVHLLIFPAIIFSIFVLIGNPVIVVILMNILGYKRRTGFMAGLTVAQISEFSLILAALGFGFGHLSREVLSLVTLVGLVTIVGSTYFILYAQEIYPYAEKILILLELKKPEKKEESVSSEKHALVLFGFDRVGEDFVKVFNKLNEPFLVVDYNPASIKRLQDANIPNRYGDAEDLEFLQELDLHQIKLAVSTIPDHKTNILLTRRIRDENKRAIVIVISRNTEQAEELYREGATYVIMPHYLGARYATNMIGRLGLDVGAFKEEREKHLEYLEKRRST